MNAFAAHQSVKVIDAEYERFGQIGVHLGPGTDEGSVAVRFDDATDDFPPEALEGI